MKRPFIVANTNKTTNGTSGANQEVLISLSAGSLTVYCTHTHSAHLMANNTIGCNCDEIALESIIVTRPPPAPSSRHPDTPVLTYSVNQHWHDCHLLHLQDGTQSDTSASPGSKSPQLCSESRQMVRKWTFVLEITLLLCTSQFDRRSKVKPKRKWKADVFFFSFCLNHQFCFSKNHRISS